MYEQLAQSRKEHNGILDARSRLYFRSVVLWNYMHVRFNKQRYIWNQHIPRCYQKRKIRTAVSLLDWRPLLYSPSYVMVEKRISVLAEKPELVGIDKNFLASR